MKPTKTKKMAQCRCDHLLQQLQEKTKREIFTKKKKGARTQKGPSGAQPQQNFLKNGGMQEGHAGATIAAAATLGCYSFVLGVMLLILLLQRGREFGWGWGSNKVFFCGGGKIQITLGNLLASYSNKHKLKKKHTHLQTHPPWKLLMPNPKPFSSPNT
jgi:hypothetical protein